MIAPMACAAVASGLSSWTSPNPMRAPNNPHTTVPAKARMNAARGGPVAGTGTTSNGSLSILAGSDDGEGESAGFTD